MPVVAFRSTVPAVIVPEVATLPSSLMSPPLAVSVTVLPVADIGFERTIICPEVSETLPVAVIAFGRLMPQTLVTLMSPAAEEMAEKPCDTLALAVSPVWATSELV